MRSCLARCAMRARLLPLLCMVMLVLSSPTVYAQRTYSPNLSFGAKAGATLSMMSMSPKIDQGLLPGFTFGGIVRYTEEKHVGIIAELNVTQRGWRESYEPGEDFKYSRTFTYLQLPVMTHIFFGPKRFRMFVNLGPEIGIMLGDHISANFDYRNVTSVPGYPGGYRRTAQLDMDVKNRFDYGIAAGIGGEYRITPRQSIMLEGRFYYGLGNIFPAARTDYFSASRSMSIEITAGWLFRVR